MVLSKTCFLISHTLKDNHKVAGTFVSICLVYPGTLHFDKIITFVWLFELKYPHEISMRGSRKFCQRGSNFYNVFCCCFFQFDEGRKDQSTTISGLSSARQRNAI